MIRMSRESRSDRDGRECSPDTMSLPYLCLIAAVAVTVGVGLAWIG